MNEGKKDRRDPIRTIKTKNPVAKNANKAIGGGAAGAHKDKKKAAKQGEVKHKKKEVAENYEQQLQNKLAEATNRHFGPKGSGTELARQTRQAEIDRKFNTPAQLQKDKDYRDYRAGIKKSKIQVKKNQVNEFAPGNGDNSNNFDPELAAMAKQEGVVKGYSLVDHATVEQALQIPHCQWGDMYDGQYKHYFTAGFMQGRKSKMQQARKDGVALTLQKDGSLSRVQQGVAEEMDIPPDGTPEYDQYINRGQKTPFDLGGADAYYGRQHDITKEYGFVKGSPEWDEYIQGYRDTYQNSDMRKDYGSSRSAVQPRRITRTPEAMNGITGPGMMRDPAMEDEGDKEGLPHLTPELAKHIADQISTEGAHAIVKSVKWGDGAADELVQFIKAALLKLASVGSMKEATTSRDKWNKASAERQQKHDKIAATQTKNGSGMKSAIDRLEKHVNAKEGWTHDSLADQLFEHERTYEEKLQNQLNKLTKK